MENIIKNIEKPLDAEGAYMGEDGFMHCLICGETLQTKINVFGSERIVTCICKCEKEQQDAEKRRVIADNIELNRLKAFRQKRMHNYTFANDDCKRPRLSEFCRKYSDNFDRYFKEGKGILFAGNVGSGKTYMASCITNAVIDSGRTALFTSLPELCRTLGSEFDGTKQHNLDLLDRYSLLVLDDLGIERDTPSMLENVYSIIDGRYRSGKPMIITTNLSVDELQNCKDMRYGRIYDRILGQSFVLSVGGESRRREHAEQLTHEAIEIMKV